MANNHKINVNGFQEFKLLLSMTGTLKVLVTIPRYF